MTEPLSPLRLPFDQYQRYRLVSDLLDRLRGDRPLRVLDVGGRTAVLRRFLRQDEIALVDVEPSDAEGLVLGSGAALPYVDDAFDVVAAFDTLEHVPPELREAFVAECARVAKGWVVLAGPYDAPRVARAEELLQQFLRDKLGVRHRYLEEHRHNGLPDRAAVEAQFESLGARVKSFGHANLERWLVLMCVSLYLDDDPSLREMAASFHEFYNRELYATDHAEPVYRHFVVAALGDAKLPEEAELFARPQAPEGSLPALGELLRELEAFDRERGEWRKERDKLREAVADLEEDLEGHRESLREAEEESAKKDRGLAELRTEIAARRAEQEEAIAVLEADLASHKGSVADLERDLATAKQDHAKITAAFEADLAEHKRSLAEVQAELQTLTQAHTSALEAMAAERVAFEKDLAARAAEVEAGQAHAAELLAELDSTRAAAADIERALLAANEAAEGLNTSLQQRSAELETAHREIERLATVERDLRAELRHRWHNLKRALHWRKPSF